ncbi:hypothetical protein [Catellatospora sp. NPDC049609]|uniref:hypothetical protein n=1 Tax=Catellatospora sp. NPDC049609 TaxID=3155505 RepID=UPI0034157677
MSMSVARGALSVAGGLGVAAGLCALLLSSGMSHWLVFGAVLAAGGAALLAAGLRGPVPGPLAWAAIAVLALAGLAASLLVVREDVCCMFAYHRGLGYPWGWLDSHAEAETMAAVEAIRADAGSLPKHLDPPKLVAAVLFWTAAAVLAVVPLTLLRRRTAD